MPCKGGGYGSYQRGDGYRSYQGASGRPSEKSLGLKHQDKGKDDSRQFKTS